MIGQLPNSLNVNGTEYEIRTDFRDVLKIVVAFGDVELKQEERIYVCLYILYKDFENMPQKDYQAALSEAIKFIDCSATEDDGKPSPRTMDWVQDESIIFAAVNKTAGMEVRSADYIHWWTFMGYFMEISDGVFSRVLSLRNKKAHHKKFEKWETEFWNNNKTLCVLQPKLTEEEKQAKDNLNKLLG